MEAVTQTVTKRKIRILLRPLTGVAILVLLPALFLRYWLPAFPYWGEFYTQEIFKRMARVLSYLNRNIPFSASELVLIMIPLLLIGMLLLFLMHLAQARGQRLRQFIKSLVSLILLAAMILASFLYFHGLNYFRLPLAKSLGLTVKARSANNLYEASVALTEAANRLRELVGEDEIGVFTLPGGARQNLLQAFTAYESAAKKWPVLRNPIKTNPKPVFFSRYMAYTGITGIYDPFLVEANVNIDIPSYSLPFTALHELAHVQGFAREDEANFLAFLTGIEHADAVFRYSVVLESWVHMTNALYGANQDLYNKVAKTLNAGSWRDIAAGGRYWKQFEGPIQEKSERVNDQFLKANAQSDGVRSYGRMVDLILAWYEGPGGKILSQVPTVTELDPLLNLKEELVHAASYSR